jgi:hypothetical protein
MMVVLEPDEVVAAFVGLDVMEQRSLAEERPLTSVYHEGKIFFERTSDGIVLWRRPKRPLWMAERDEVHRYPEVLEVRIEALPRGSRVEMRWRPHPLTPVAVRSERIGIVVAVCGLVPLAIVASTRELVLLALVLPFVFVGAVFAHLRFRRSRRALRALIPRAYAALAPHELGRADVEGSAFRAVPAPGNEATSASEPRRR